MVLALASRARAQVLEAVGLPCIRDPSSPDESEIEADFLARGAGVEEAAATLARAKAEALSPRHSGALVIGAYRLEGLGAQLFSEIEGDFFTILGLPLLPLLTFLRQQGIGII